MTETDAFPDGLVEAAIDRRLIPFVGAGMSSAVGLPRWDALLKHVAERLPSDIPYGELREMCGGDPMKVAEYLFIQSGREIGPLRHRISEALSNGSDPGLSSPHIDLINLGCERIYTTNYDDAIEQTFGALDEDVFVVATARHIAQGRRSAVPELVKFHGDLQWESTLVLTESSYYNRLQFDSPLDIKFRSDLLGNSVLFLGYGFADLNIRIIWHRLMSMMSEVDSQERPRSFILRQDTNSALDQLDSAVGITTVTRANAGLTHTQRLSEFLFELSVRCSPTGEIPGSTRQMFLTPLVLASGPSLN